MVGLLAGAPGEGPRGKLTGDPAVVEAAAVAIDLGLDPLRYLGLHPDDLEVVTAAMTKALKLRQDRFKSNADYQAARTAGLTVQGLTRWIASALRRK